tara:strand:+ start:829 stop:1113 length:285 start_codon:yes stop_codon:yes gene_type:complete
VKDSLLVNSLGSSIKSSCGSGSKNGAVLILKKKGKGEKRKKGRKEEEKDERKEKKRKKEGKKREEKREEERKKERGRRRSISREGGSKKRERER